MVGIDRLRDLFDFFRKAVIAAIFLSKYYLLQSSIGNALYRTWKDRRYDTGFRTAEIDFFRTTYADPEQITRKINQNSFGYQYTQVGRIETGEFPIASVRFEHYYVYTSLYDHFVNGADWEETAYYTMAFDQVDATDLGWSQIPDYEALDEFFEELDELYESIESKGYRSSAEFKPDSGLIASFVLDPIRAHDEVFIDIGRDGELLLTDGRHRVAIARILSLEEIPVRILARHREWCRFRSDLLGAIRSNELQGDTVSKYSICHPEFHHIESRYDPETLAARIESIVEPGQGPIVEYDPGVSGALLHELSSAGYEAVAIATDDDQHRYLEWYAEFENGELQAQLASQIDGTLDGCTMIALEPVDRAGLRECLERLDVGRLVTTDETVSQEQFGERVEIVNVSDLE